MEHEANVINGFSNGVGPEIEISHSEVGDVLSFRAEEEMLETESEVEKAVAETSTANVIRAEKSQKMQEIVEEVDEQKHVKATTEQCNRSESSSNHRTETRLYNAALEGNIQVIRDILQGDNNYPHLRFQTQAGNSILHVHVAAPVDKRPANIPFLEEILVSDPNLVDIANNRGETPLHIAAKFGQLDAVMTFLDGARSRLFNTNKDGDTALHMAVRNNHLRVVEYFLMVSGSDILMDYTANTAGKISLYLAVESGSVKLITLLLQKCQVVQSGQDFTGSMLHAAVLQGNSDVVSKIMEIGIYKELISATDESGLTPVHYAAGSDNDILEVLLKTETSATEVYLQDRQGRTAAHLAAQCNDVEGLKKIITYYPYCCEVVDFEGRNVVHYAAMLGCADALDYFLTETRFGDIVAMEDCRGDTPLHLLARTIPDFPVAYLRQYTTIITKHQGMLRICAIFRTWSLLIRM